MSEQKKTPREYPRITPMAEEMLIELAQKYAQYPDFLTHKDCKYPVAVKNAIASIAARNGSIKPVTAPNPAKTTQNPTETDEMDLEEVDIHLESTRLFQNLKTFMNDTSKMETSEKAQIFRTATALLEKLLTIKEKSSGIQKYEEFKALVMNTLDRHLTPVQITNFIEQVEELEK